MKYKARYWRIRSNPFTPIYTDLAGKEMTITTEIPDNTSRKEVERLAKEATPKGFEFIEVAKA